MQKRIFRLLCYSMRFLHHRLDLCISKPERLPWKDKICHTTETKHVMKQRRWGRVIHMSSIMGLASTKGRNVYSATKSALIGLARASSLDLGEFGITVNCIAPGPILTEMPMSILSEEQKAVFAERTALQRWGKPEEIAGPALLLASGAGSYITGAVLVVDGGVMNKMF